MTKTGSKPGPLTDDLRSSEAHGIEPAVDGLDQIRLAMERKWGVGRLRLLVLAPLRAKFDEQRDRLEQALATKNEVFVGAQVEGMHRAWQALDRAACEAGETPLASQVWECVLPSTGEIVSLVRTQAEAHLVARAGPVFTLAEIATLIAATGDGVLEAKRQFPGAKITRVRRKPSVDWLRGDDIPF